MNLKNYKCFLPDKEMIPDLSKWRPECELYSKTSDHKFLVEKWDQAIWASSMFKETQNKFPSWKVNSQAYIHWIAQEAGWKISGYYRKAFLHRKSVNTTRIQFSKLSSSIETKIEGIYHEFKRKAGLKWEHLPK